MTQKKTPFISVCIPAYKRPEQLRRLLQSAAAQTYSNFEIVITDDTPGSEVSDLVQTFPQLAIQYYKNNPAAGTPGNWNIAILKSQAPWVHLLHADDWFATPDSMAQFAAACRNTKSSFVFCASKEVNNTGNAIKTLQLSSPILQLLNDDPLYLVYDNIIGHPSAVIHKRDHHIQYNIAFKWVVDIDFYMRFLQQHPSFEYINEPLINIGIDEEQVSATAYKNPSVEIPEYLQLISSLQDKQISANWYVFHSLWNLVKKFRIKDMSFINKHGYRGPHLMPLDFIIRYQKKIPRIILKQTPWSAVLAKKSYNRWLKSDSSASV